MEGDDATAFLVPSEGQRFARPVPGSVRNVFRDTEKRFRKWGARGRNSNKKKRRKNEKKEDEEEGADLDVASSVLDFASDPLLYPAIYRDQVRQIDLSGSRAFWDSLPDAQKHLVPLVGRAFVLESRPGMIFIPNPFSEGQQRSWSHSIVRDCPIDNPSNISNLKAVRKVMMVDGKEDQGSKSSNEKEEKDDRERGFDQEMILRRWTSDHHMVSILQELRWVTLGFHFQWTPRVYSRRFQGRVCFSFNTIHFSVF